MREAPRGMLILLVVAAMLMGAATQDAPSYTQSPLLVMDAQSIANGSPAVSGKFYLQSSESFSLEWQASAAPNFDVDLVMEDQAGDLCNSGTTPACEVPNQSIKVAETDRAGYVTFTPVFTNRPIAVRVTNNAGPALTLSLWLHRDHR